MYKLNSKLNTLGKVGIGKKAVMNHFVLQKTLLYAFIYDLPHAKHMFQAPYEDAYNPRKNKVHKQQWIQGKENILVARSETSAPNL